MRWISPSRPTLLQAFLAVAEHEGWFAEEGLALDVAAGRGTADAVAALARGEAEFGMAAPLSFCPAIADSGAPIIAIAQVAYRGFFEIASDPARPITRAAELAGKRIGVVSAGGGTAMQLDAVARAGGLDPARVARVVTGLGLEGLAALRRGEVDGFFAFYESRAALEAAGERLAYLAMDDIAPMPGGAILARLDALDAARQVLRACLRGLALMREEAATARVLAAQPASLQGDLAARALARLRIGLHPPPGIPPGAIDDVAWREALEMMARLGLMHATDRRLARFFDGSFLPR